MLCLLFSVLAVSCIDFFSVLVETVVFVQYMPFLGKKWTESGDSLLRVLEFTCFRVIFSLANFVLGFMISFDHLHISANS